MFDSNNNYTGSFYGKDRLGHTTPDCDASDPLQPFLPVSYPAPWLPAKRRDDAHPVGATVVLSQANIVGVDKNGALIPAGYFSGSTATKASGGKFCYVTYSADDVGFTRHLKTGNLVTAADLAKPVLIASPSDGDGAAGETVDTIAFTGAEVAWAKTCNLIPGGQARGLGYAIRNMWQYIGGIKVNSTTGGIAYDVKSMDPTKSVMHNYQHEPGNAIRTSFVIRVPWIGDSPTKLQTLADGDGVANYVQSAYSKSFTHFTGVKGNAAGNLYQGCLVVPSTFAGDAGNYMPFDPAKHTIDNVVGRVLGFEYLYPVKDYADRVRTQFERHQDFKGPFAERNAVTGMMGGSATRGMTYQVSVGTNGLFRAALDQGKTIHEEYYTTVLIRILL